MSDCASERLRSHVLGEILTDILMLEGLRIFRCTRHGRSSNATFGLCTEPASSEHPEKNPDLLHLCSTCSMRFRLMKTPGGGVLKLRRGEHRQASIPMNDLYQGEGYGHENTKSCTKPTKNKLATSLPCK